MEKNYIYISEIQIPLYRGDLVVVFTDSISKLNNHIDYKPDEDLYAHAMILDWKGTRGYMIVLNFNNLSRKIYHGVIAHEATHIAKYIAEYAGIKLDYDNQEPITYLVEWITDQIYYMAENLGFQIKSIKV